MKKILVAGSLNMDLVFLVDRIPNMGETLKSRQFIMNPGGKGANQAVACCKMGSDVHLIGCVGDDLFGINMIKELDGLGIHTRYLSHIKAASTGVAAILVDNGDNRIIIDSGANANTNYSQILKAIEEIGQAGDIFLTQLEIPIDAVVFGLKKAKEKKMVTILNPAPAYKLPDHLYPAIDIIIPNVIEAEMITGFNHREKDFDQKVIDFFIEKGVTDVVITKGSHGAVYGNKDILMKFDAFKVEVTDTTGAGDTFVGTIATEVAKGKKVVDSIQRASAAAAITVSRFGAQQAIPNLKELEDFLGESEEKN